MVIGVLSDSHGRVEATRRAVAALRERGAEVLVHLGDVETEQVIDELVGHPTRLVFGNCDWNLDRLSRYAELAGVTVDHPMGVIDTGTRRVAFTHGHLTQCVRDALSQGVDYLLHGHTHEVRDEREGSTRIINPGALFRAARYTCALLDPDHDRLEILEVEKPTP